MPNDNAYGSVGWQSLIVVTTEETEYNSQVLLVATRLHGSYGTIIVHYVTVEITSVGIRERAAEAGIDFTPVQGNVTMAEGVTEAYVMITIQHVRYQVPLSRFFLFIFFSSL